MIGEAIRKEKIEMKEKRKIPGGGRVWMRPWMKARRSDPCWRILRLLRASLVLFASVIFFIPLPFSYQLTQITFFCFSMVFELTQSTMLLEKDSNFDFSSLFMGNVNLS